MLALLPSVESALGYPLLRNRAVSGGDDSDAMVVWVKEPQGEKKYFVKFNSRDRNGHGKFEAEAAGLLAIVSIPPLSPSRERKEGDKLMSTQTPSLFFPSLYWVRRREEQRP